MKNKIRLSLFILAVFITSSCFPGKELSESKIVILPLSDTVTLREGSIVYALPRTVFTVVVDMERTIEIPGPYSRFAGDLLGLNNVILNENESWEISNIKINSTQEIDPSEFYVISSNTLFQSNVLALKKEGLILDLAPSAFIADLVQTGTRGTNSESMMSFDLGSDEYFQLLRDTAYKRVSVDSSFIRIPYIVEKKKKLTEDQLAEKAAKRLMDLRDGKLLILSGEATVYPQNEAAINEINRIEKEYTELFTGKILKETRTFVYQVIPSKEMVGKPVTLFKLSEATGPVSANVTVGKPVTIEFVPEQKTKDLTFIDKPQTGSVSPGFDKLFYRMPDVVNVKILLVTEQLLSSRRLIYQFGQIISLPANYIIGK